MKNILKQSGQILRLQIALLAATACYSAHGAVTNTNAAAAEKTMAVPDESAARKSVFQDDLRNGKDPFFPKSTRRAEKVPGTGTKAIAPVIQLALKGISGQANQRFALINNKTLTVGEAAYIRIETGQVKVRCLEIRENSVIISIEGDPEHKELRLREGL